MPYMNPTCPHHGGPYINGQCITEVVLELVRNERTRQFQKYGTNAKQVDGTGPDIPWAEPFTRDSAVALECGFRSDYDNTVGPVTWMQLIREEVAEAFQEADPDRLSTELIQVAALCVSWVEKISMRDNEVAHALGKG